jgi:tetratricopeptide (TPR) repeat protein
MALVKGKLAVTFSCRVRAKKILPMTAMLFLFTGNPLPENRPLEIAPPLRLSLERAHQGQYENAIESANELAVSLPNHPLPHLIAAEAYFGLIYCDIGHITSEEIRNVADRKASSFDAKFSESAGKSLAASGKMRQNPETAAVGALYSGLVRGTRTRLYTLRAERSKSAAEAKQMRADLMDAVARNPGLTPDANLGLGSYNYYIDILSAPLKVVRFIMGNPAGDRDQGITQLKTASDKASLVAVEAQYELARIYGMEELRHADALQMYGKLSAQFPGNALPLLLAAYQAEQTNQKDMAMDYVRKAVEASKTMDGVCRQRLGEAGQKAMARLLGKIPK